MGEVSRGMETLMVCCDYGHAGMMSFPGCVYLETNLLRHKKNGLCYTLYATVCMCKYSSMCIEQCFPNFPWDPHFKQMNHAPTLPRNSCSCLPFNPF